MGERSLLPSLPQKSRPSISEDRNEVKSLPKDTVPRTGWALLSGQLQNTAPLGLTRACLHHPARLGSEGAELKQGWDATPVPPTESNGDQLVTTGLLVCQHPSLLNGNPQRSCREGRQAAHTDH